MSSEIVLCSAEPPGASGDVLCRGAKSDLYKSLSAQRSGLQPYKPYESPLPAPEASLSLYQITKVMLLKGWRCVECIVCEVCGQASDPSRLLLCDDCDISYHTYCLDPPLLTVPKGGWKCKW